MAEDRTLSYGFPLPASWLAALQEFLGATAMNFHLTLIPPVGPAVNATGVQVLAGTLSAQVGLGIDGLFRYITAPATAAVTGSAGLYDVFAVTGPNIFASTPSPDTDNTIYAFQLQVLPHGTTPTLTTLLTNFRQVGELDWDGTSITSLRQLVGEIDARQAINPTAVGATQPAVRTIVPAAHTAPVQTWEAAGAVVASVDATGTFTMPTKAPSDSSTAGATTAFVHGSKRVSRQGRAFTMADSFAVDPTVAVLGSFVIAAAAGETVTLVGVWLHSESGSTSVFEVTYDHAVHGTMVPVSGLTGLTPTTGAAQWVAVGPLPVVDGDRISVVITTLGTSMGCMIEPVTEHTA